MKIFLSYKQTGIDKENLDYQLVFFKEKIENMGHKIFIAYFEEYENMSKQELDKFFLENIKKSDLVLAFVNYQEKSEGQLLELGMAYALNKKIKVLLNSQIEKNYYLIYGLGEVYKFDKLENIKFEEII